MLIGGEDEGIREQWPLSVPLFISNIMTCKIMVILGALRYAAASSKVSADNVAACLIHPSRGERCPGRHDVQLYLFNDGRWPSENQVWLL